MEIIPSANVSMPIKENQKIFIDFLRAFDILSGKSAKVEGPTAVPAGP
jgi:hypothetical protein